mgnify:CR=1 FL=1
MIAICRAASIARHAREREHPGSIDRDRERVSVRRRDVGRRGVEQANVLQADMVKNIHGTPFLDIV